MAVRPPLSPSIRQIAYSCRPSVQYGVGGIVEDVTRKWDYMIDLRSMRSIIDLAVKAVGIVARLTASPRGNLAWCGCARVRFRGRETHPTGILRLLLPIR